MIIMSMMAALTASVLSGAGLSAAGASAEPPLAVAATDPALTWGPCPPPFTTGCEIAVLHGNPARPNADVFLRVPGGYEIPAHSHTSAERMVLVGGQMRVQYKGAAAVVLKSGDYAYGPAKRPHAAACASQQPCVLFIAFEGPVDAMTASMD